MLFNRKDAQREARADVMLLAQQQRAMRYGDQHSKPHAALYGGMRRRLRGVAVLNGVSLMPFFKFQLIIWLMPPILFIIFATPPAFTLTEDYFLSSCRRRDAGASEVETQRPR